MLDVYRTIKPVQLASGLILHKLKLGVSRTFDGHLEIPNGWNASSLMEAVSERDHDKQQNVIRAATFVF